MDEVPALLKEVRGRRLGMLDSSSKIPSQLVNLYSNPLELSNLPAQGDLATSGG